jgi:hypothetical protein
MQSKRHIEFLNVTPGGIKETADCKRLNPESLAIQPKAQ